MHFSCVLAFRNSTYSNGSYGNNYGAGGSYGNSFGSNNSGGDGYLDNEAGSQQTFFPPSSVVPFEGFTLYTLPFTYLSSKVEEIYPIFKKMYCKYLCKLHSISGEPGTLLSLCNLFEYLLFETSPEVCYTFLHLEAEAKCEQIR